MDPCAAARQLLPPLSLSSSSSSSSLSEEASDMTSWCDDIEYTSRRHHGRDGVNDDDDDVNNGDLDLEWDYLTRTYDKDDFFHDDSTLLNETSVEEAALVDAAAIVSSRASNGFAATNMTTTPTEPSWLSSNNGQQGALNCFSTEDLVEQLLHDLSCYNRTMASAAAGTTTTTDLLFPHQQGSFHCPETTMSPANGGAGSLSCGMHHQWHPLQLSQQQPMPLAVPTTMTQFVSTPRILELMPLPTPSTTTSSTTEKDIASIQKRSSYCEPTPNLFALMNHNIAAKSNSGDGISKLRQQPIYPRLIGLTDKMTDIATTTADLLSDKSNKATPVITPLTAYNYFYRNERDTIVNGMQHAHDALPPSDLDFTPTKMAALLHHHWHVDPFRKKREHRKTHGVMSFTTLAKVISHRWKQLPEHGREFYREVANVDLQRYERHLAERRQEQRQGGTPTIAPSPSTLTATSA